MSGFLNRIAARAVRPQTSVHPFAESIYSVARQTGTSEAAGVHEALSAHGEQGAAQSMALPVDPAGHSEEALTSHSEMQTHQTVTVDDRRSIQPLLPRQVAGLADASKHSSPDAQSSPADSLAASHRGFSGQGEGLEYVPIVPGPFARSNAPEAGGVSSMQALEESIAAARSKQNAQAAQVSQDKHAASQGDDVQIHIGRIEVVAVPQAPPRPAHSPARKGLSLEEYLRKRDGRAG